MGYHYDIFEDYLKANKDRFLIFIDVGVEKLFWFLHSPKAKNIITNSQIEILITNSQEECKETIKNSTKVYFADNIEFFALPLYQEKQSKFIKELKREIIVETIQSEGINNEIIK